MTLHWLFSALAVGLIVCGVALIVLLIWHNRLLQRAHVELNRAKLDLEAANRAVNDANAELQQQNRILRERDVALRTQNERFDAALNNMSQGLCMVDPSQRLIVCNSRFQRPVRACVRGGAARHLDPRPVREHHVRLPISRSGWSAPSSRP